MRVGELLGGRFRIEALAETGGMGVVYRARDLHTGALVAAKVLVEPSPQQRARFEQEAELLSRLSHPGIVRCLAYEAPPGEIPYLIMEWLEGEDLGRLLARRQLSVAEAVELGARVASALGAAHAAGIVHRDLKPGNVFLVEGRISQPRIVDFGIAHSAASPRMTVAGELVGTPGYMAPEQARSSHEIGPPADVFALGCVLFECLTGAHPFQADQVSAMLARVIFDEAPPLGERCPRAPAWLEALLAQMLAKDPARRPPDGAAVAAALAAREALDPLDLSNAPPPSSALTGSERRFLGVLVVGSPAACAIDATVSAADLAASAAELREIAARLGQHLEVLADGTAVLAVGYPAVPTDIAAQVARCALALQERAPDRPMAITAGWGELGRGLPVGDALGRASRLLGEGARGAAAPPILLDPAAAGLLEARFEIADRGGGVLELRGEHPLGEASRPLLGRPAPCVGRDHELRMLEQSFAACAEEPSAMAVMVTGPAGMGKSRLIQELVGRIRRSGEPAAIWIGWGDPLRAGSSGGLLAEALRGAAGIQGGEPLEARRELLRARVALRVPAPEVRRVTEFLGELLGVPFSDEGSLPLRAARQDPDLLGEQMQRALREFLRAECAAQPVMLVLEDVHWADRVSLSLVDAALRDLPGEPLFVLASARPDIDELSPRLWAARGRQDLRLRHIAPRAGERLARRALGDAVDAALIQRLVAQSEGHPFFLEELIRAAAEGRSGALPDTVVAMVQARLDALEPRARRALRAASVFGEVFWRGAIAHLLGVDEPGLDQVLAALVEQELCVLHRESRIPGEPQYAFRQALLREGAYGLLTGEDRALGHRLAAEWLERSGEADPLVLAAHLERGGLPARAATLYLAGAERASARQAYLDAERCYDSAAELLGALPLAARRARALTRFRLARHEDALADLAAARAEAAAEAEIGTVVELHLDQAMVLDWMGEFRAAGDHVAAAEACAAAVVSPLLGARLLLGVGRSLHRADREKEAAATLARAAEQAARLGDDGYETRLIALLLLGFILPGLGRVEEAARALDEVIHGCEERSDLMHLGAALNNRAFVRAYRGDRGGMIADFERTIALGRELGQATLELVGHYNFAEYSYLMDDLGTAEAHARDARAVAPRCGEHLPSVVPLLEARLCFYRGDEAGARALISEIRARPAHQGGALTPSEDVLCATIELAAGDAGPGAWSALEDRSARCSVGQERIEVLETRGLAALRRGRRAEAREQLERALSVAARIPNVMGERLRRWVTAVA